jgi:hypothetical protein
MQRESRIHRFEAKDVAFVTTLALLDVAKKRCKPPLILSSVHPVFYTTR